MTKKKQNSYRSETIQRVLIPTLFLLCAMTVGTVGYSVIEGLPVLDSLYLTVSSIFLTVSYIGNPNFSVPGKVFTVIFLIFGVFSLFYAVTTIIEFIIEGNIAGIRRKRKMEDKIRNMKEHYIICGYGRVGHQIAQTLEAEKKSYVVVDTKPETEAELKEKGIPFIIGPVSDDFILEKAGIKNAKVLFASADSDTENVYVTLTAKVLNPSIFIVARASHKESEMKLKRAGANKVSSPYFIAGSRMASMALHPVSAEFVDIITGWENMELWMRETRIKDGSPLSNRSIADAKVRQNTGAMILSIKKPDGAFIFNPGDDTKLEARDTVVALGTNKQLEEFEKLLGNHVGQ